MPQFIESQTYGWLFNGIGALVIIGGIIFVLRHTDNKKVALACCTPFVLLGLYFMTERLDTRIDAMGITYRMFPAQWNERHIKWEQVTNVDMINDIPYTRRDAEKLTNMYILNDDAAMRVSLNDGSKIYIGTRKPDETMEAVRINNVSSAH